MTEGLSRLDQNPRHNLNAIRGFLSFPDHIVSGESLNLPAVPGCGATRSLLPPPGPGGQKARRLRWEGTTLACLSFTGWALGTGERELGHDRSGSRREGMEAFPRVSSRGPWRLGGPPSAALGLALVRQLQYT